MYELYSCGYFNRHEPYVCMFFNRGTWIIYLHTLSTFYHTNHCYNTMLGERTSQPHWQYLGSWYSGWQRKTCSNFAQSRLKKKPKCFIKLKQRVFAVLKARLAHSVHIAVCSLSGVQHASGRPIVVLSPGADLECCQTLPARVCHCPHSPLWDQQLRG